MDTSDEGLAILYHFEGKHELLPDGRYRAYLDKLAVPHVWTIYAGLTKGVKEGMIVDEAEGERLLRKELSVAEDAVERLVTVSLNVNEFSALVVMVYNIGVGAFEGSTMLKLLNAGKREQVPAQMMRWTHAGGVEYAGLVARRKAEAALFMKPVLEDHPVPAAEGEVAVPTMPQRVEEKPSATAGEVVTQSWTIRGALVALAGFIVQFYSWLLSVFKDAGTEILSLKSAAGPFDALLTAAKVSAPALGLMFILAGIVIVIMRRMHSGKEGKVG